MASHIVHIGDRPNIESDIVRPGHETAPRRAKKATRFLGIRGEDFVDPKEPPYAYMIERPKGDVTPEHSHNAGRTEFLIEGEIEWREPGVAPRIYSAGTLTYVEAGTIYGYTVVEDAKILIQFDDSPGMNYR